MDFYTWQPGTGREEFSLLFRVSPRGSNFWAPSRPADGHLSFFDHPPPLYAFATGQGLASGAFPMPTVDARSDSDPRALTILHEWVKTTGAEMNEARLRLTRIPQGADLILNKVSGASGFCISSNRDSGRALDHASDAR